MWIFAVWLYLLFLAGAGGNTTAQAMYDGLKADGATCYVYLSDHGEKAPGPAPVCFYEVGR